MRNRIVRYWIMFALLTVAAYFSLAHLLSQGGDVLLADLAAFIPKQIGEWSGKDSKITEGTKRLLGSENVLIREYSPSGSGRAILLCVIFAGGSHRIAHPPEVCYEGQGWAITINEELDLEFPSSPPVIRKINHLRITGARDVLDVVVWYRTPDSETASFLWQKLKMLFGGGRWSFMIRLSTNLDPEDPDGSLQRLARFGAGLQPHLDALSRAMEGR